MPSPHRPSAPTPAAEALLALGSAVDAVRRAGATGALSIEVDYALDRGVAEDYQRALLRDASAHERMALPGADDAAKAAFAALADAVLDDVRPRFESWALRYASEAGNSRKPFLQLKAGPFVIDGNPERVVRRAHAFAATLRAAIPDPQMPRTGFALNITLIGRAREIPKIEVAAPSAAAAIALVCAHQRLTAPNADIHILGVARVLPEQEIESAAAQAAALIGAGHRGVCIAGHSPA